MKEILLVIIILFLWGIHASLNSIQSSNDVLVDRVDSLQQELRANGEEVNDWLDEINSNLF